MASTTKFIKERGLELFILVLFVLTLFALFLGAGAVLLKMLFATMLAFLVAILTGDKLQEAFKKYGLDRYWRTILILCFIIIGLWNWFALILLLLFILVWYII